MGACVCVCTIHKLYACVSPKTNQNLNDQITATCFLHEQCLQNDRHGLRKEVNVKKIQNVKMWIITVAIKYFTAIQKVLPKNALQNKQRKPSYNIHIRRMILLVLNVIHNTPTDLRLCNLVSGIIGIGTMLYGC